MSEFLRGAWKYGKLARNGSILRSLDQQYQPRSVDGLNPYCTVSPICLTPGCISTADLVSGYPKEIKSLKLSIR